MDAALVTGLGLGVLLFFPPLRPRPLMEGQVTFREWSIFLIKTT
ncbi:MAG: hypothetical protein ACP5I4_13260 [Oceanipulchritudo sp.]